MSLVFDKIPPWITPVLHWNLIQAITGLTSVFTPSHSPLRPVAATITAVLASLLQANIQTHFAATRPSGPVVAMCWVNVLNAIDLLVLTQASYEAQLAHQKKNGPNTKHQDSLLTKLLFALILPYNYRRINTPWQISRLPPFSSTNPSYIPSKPEFLLRSTVKLLLAASLIHLLTLDPSDPNLSIALTHLDESKSVLLPFRNFTFNASSILLQARFTLSFGIVTRAAIAAGYTAGSILAVVFGSDPASWPPVAGSLTEAWTLKRLWGQSWHQTLRRPLTSNATFLTNTLGLPPTSTAAHWIRIAITFLGSGAIHSLMDLAFGVPLSKTGAWAFYGLQIFGLALESIAQALGNRTGLSLSLGKRAKRGIGYIWVCVFLFWTTPVWINPVLVGLWRDGTRVMSPWLGMRSG